ncbi:hypothetical protein [Caproicibacterium amylolyticum]|uniref:Uncharacterized protein n=1 Tax=Caproicibacterium amylolyticum TaxID=2766537 RepID=A0A7G9WJP6_9FIRM|nr:hypothetical protein [Caproicibacterium amylolyticum]QNO18908.1 hypothetical protein H6X83_04575 [Caproicibacterium amylolyticum]
MRTKTSTFEICGHSINVAGKSFVYIHDSESNQNFAAVSFEVEVRKDFAGQPYFVVKADALLDDKPLHTHLWLLETTDFNAAYDLKNALCTLLGDPPSRYQMQHCTGALLFRGTGND